MNTYLVTEKDKTFKNINHLQLYYPNTTTIFILSNYLYHYDIF